MLIFNFFLLIQSKTEVTNPPISFYSSDVHFFPGSTRVPLNQVASYLSTNGFLTNESAERMEKRMKFATQAGTLEHTLDLNINPYSTSTRIAKEISTKICCKKDGQYVNISIGKVVATTYIRSEVVTTTSSTFLWWEWDKSTTIEWRPLTGSELSQVEDYLSNLAHIYDFRMNEVTY